MLELATATLACLWLLVAFTPITRWSSRALVRADTPAPADAIFVLSSSVQYDDDPSPAALSRGTRGLELLGEGLAPRLYLSELGLPAGSYRGYLQKSARRMHLPGAEQIFDVGVVRNTHDEAVRVANDTEYGLSSAVFSRDIQRAMAVAARLETGICHINGPTVSDEAQMPFGGVKGSGYGRFGGKAAIHEFTDLRWITIEDAQQHYPF